MATIARKRRKSRRTSRSSLIEQMEAAAPSGDKLRRLVKRHPAPQEWYDEDDSAARTPKPRR
jgi:hypothetical protein